MLDLSTLPSILNSNAESFDYDKAFTYIEFIKLFPYTKENDAEFIQSYTTYIHQWCQKKEADGAEILSDYEQVLTFELLKTITLTYSSYEEQRFISNLDFTDKEQIRNAIPIFSKRILDIAKFYRKKRQDARDIIRKNSFVGGVKSVEEVIYQKIIDWMFSNKDIQLSYAEIKRDLTVSVSNYVDTYAEYFDIPRDEDIQDKLRENYDMLTANMNTVDYRYFVQVNEVVGGMLYTGDVHLKEIPLIAQLGLDLSQECVGDLLAMKNTLTYQATINRIDLDEQIDIKRRLYRKYIGVDLYYAYMDADGNILQDLLCKATNPTGNLINTTSADTATIPSNQIKELNKIGLFFKPDKMSILKVSARDYTWEFDTSKMTRNSWYIFPDPAKYGDIGVNKQKDYPLIMTYKDTYDVRNLSSGEAVHNPLIYIGNQNWRTYYTKQDDILQIVDNDDFSYGFNKIILDGYCIYGSNYLSDESEISNVKQDIYGNMFSLKTRRLVPLKSGFDVITMVSSIDGEYRGIKKLTIDLH